MARDTSEIVSSSACFRFGDPGDAERSEATLSAPSAEVGEETLAAAIITRSARGEPLRSGLHPSSRRQKEVGKSILDLARARAEC